MRLLLIASLACLLAPAATLAEALGPDDIIASRGGVSLTVREVDAKVRSMPPELQGQYLNDPDRMSRTIDTMLLTKQVAREGERRGLHETDTFAADLELQRIELLARQQMQAHMASLQLPDITRMARERYLANPRAYMTKARVDLRHLLISPNDERDDDAAKALAADLYEQAKRGRDFIELVMEYSDDPGKTHGAGMVPNAESSRLDPDFAKALGALDKPGDLVGPVRSRFGWHVVRLEHFDPAKPMPFEDVQKQIENEIREAWLADQRARYMTSLSGLDVELNGDAVRLLPARYEHLTPESGPGSVAAPTGAN